MINRLIFLSAVVASLTVGSSASAGQARGIPDNAIEQLRAADLNKDGQVSRPELISHRAAQWARFDRSGDGYFSRDDLPGFVQDRWNGEKLVLLRNAYDRDHDDRISRAEFVSGPPPAFDMADTNRDGLVNEAELRAAAAQIRG